MPTPPQTPAEKFDALLQWLGHLVVTRHLVGLLGQALSNPIIDRIRGIKQLVARIAARVAAGRYRRVVVVRRRGVHGQRRRNPLPKKFGWLLELVPDAVGSHGQLDNLLRDAEMLALLAAAPETLGRPLRSLCWALRVTPPPILAPPRRPSPPPEPPDPATAPKTSQPPPATTQPTPLATTRRPPPRACGPPRPARALP